MSIRRLPDEDRQLPVTDEQARGADGEAISCCQGRSMVRITVSEKTKRSRTFPLRIMFWDLSRSVCEVSISRSSARRTCFQDPVHLCWPASEHTPAPQPHEHHPAPYFRPSVAAATVEPDRAAPLSATTHALRWSVKFFGPLFSFLGWWGKMGNQ
jgi:hypothetical protein